MKRFTFILCFIFFSFIAICQTRVVCVGTSTSFNGDGNQGEYTWFIVDRLTGVTVNGSVATISGGTTQFGVSITDANNINLNFSARGKFTIRVVRTTSSWFSTTVRFESSTDVDVPTTIPVFNFTGALANCGASFTLNGTEQQNVRLQWSRLTNGSFVDIPGATGRTVNVQPPFVTLQLTATSDQCNEAIGFSKAPPAGLADLSLSEPVGQFDVCIQQSRIFTATARFCDGVAGGWVWSSSGKIQLIGSPTQGAATSSISFKLLSTGAGGPASISVSNSGQPAGSAPASNFYMVMSYPTCRNQQQLAKPIDNNPILPSSDKSESDKIAISDDPNSDLKTENTEGVTISSSKNNASIKKAIYPNPANDVLNVDNIEGVQSIQIMDLNGKLIQTVSIEENEISRTLNVSNLSDGMYILKKIKQDGQLEAAKFQVMH